MAAAMHARAPAFLRRRSKRCPHSDTRQYARTGTLMRRRALLLAVHITQRAPCDPVSVRAQRWQPRLPRTLACWRAARAWRTGATCALLALRLLSILTPSAQLARGGSEGNHDAALATMRQIISHSVRGLLSRWTKRRTAGAMPSTCRLLGLCARSHAPLRPCMQANAHDPKVLCNMAVLDYVASDAWEPHRLLDALENGMAAMAEKCGQRASRVAISPRSPRECRARTPRPVFSAPQAQARGWQGREGDGRALRLRAWRRADRAVARRCPCWRMTRTRGC